MLGRYSNMTCIMCMCRDTSEEKSIIECYIYIYIYIKDNVDNSKADECDLTKMLRKRELLNSIN